MTKTFYKVIFLSSGLLFTFGCWAQTEYKTDYDYPNQGEDWYGNPDQRTPWMDYGTDNNIPTQQGDDFCFGHDSSQVNMGQGPEMRKTNEGLTAYEFYREGGNLCLDINMVGGPPPNDDLIFINGFE